MNSLICFYNESWLVIFFLYKEALLDVLLLVRNDIRMHTLCVLTVNVPSLDAYAMCAVACDSQQCGSLTCVDSDEPVQPLFKLRHSKCCLVSS